MDDEPLLLESLADVLHRHFDVVTAGSGREGLRLLADEGPFAAVVSDLAMPEMDGIEFLSVACVAAPDTVRVLLTGRASLRVALDAVNEGHIFRFLIKPCAAADLVRALDDAVEQARLLTADRALVDRRLDAMASHLLRAERLASLGTLASAVGHELNNQLMILSGVLSTIAEQAEHRDAPTGEELADLARVRDAIGTHASNLLHLGGPTPDSGPTTCDLQAVVDNVLRMLRHAGLLRLTAAHIEVPRRPVVARIRPGEFEQVIVNLVKNAVDALAEHPPERPTLHIRIAASAATRTASCAVGDNAGGIPPDRLPLVFEPYYTTKPDGRGTGLGLFVVRQIVSGAGGDVSVTSSPGSGTTFEVTLPLG